MGVRGYPRLLKHPDNQFFIAVFIQREPELYRKMIAAAPEEAPRLRIYKLDCFLRVNSFISSQMAQARPDEASRRPREAGWELIFASYPIPERWIETKWSVSSQSKWDGSAAPEGRPGGGSTVSQVWRVITLIRSQWPRRDPTRRRAGPVKRGGSYLRFIFYSRALD